MSEVLIPMGSQKAFASTDHETGRVFKWSTTPEYVTYCGEGERPLGIIMADVLAGEILSKVGAAEWFIKAGKVRVPLDTDIAIGTAVMAGANGTITTHTGTNHAFGVVVSTRNADGEAEIWIY